MKNIDGYDLIIIVFIICFFMSVTLMAIFGN